jgi:DNA repair ATPase RecN
VAELGAYLNTYGDMQRSLSSARGRVTECEDQLQGVEEQAERSADRVAAKRSELARVEEMQRALKELQWQVGIFTYISHRYISNAFIYT